MKIIIAFCGVVAISVCIAYYLIIETKNSKPPDVLNPIDLNPETVDQDLLQVGQGHKIGAFSFINQDGKKIGLNDVKGKVFVAEYFFTTCQTICPQMNDQMQRVQYAFKQEDNFTILSFTVNPEVDTVEKMKRYANEHGAISGKWHFLTGDKEQLYHTARKYFFLLKKSEVENQGDVGSDFIHTNNFVLIDKEQRIRGYYDGTNPKEVDKLINDAKQILKE
ncbi:MAG: SCO family protein [Bacteroidetes bacterium]|nr:SCO family protein [Bacteroidota bacterium]